MSQFIELHQSGSNESYPVIINVDWIEYVSKLDNGSLIHFSSVYVDGQQDRVTSRAYTMHVTEDYYTIKEILRCK